MELFLAIMLALFLFSFVLIVAGYFLSPYIFDWLAGYEEKISTGSIVTTVVHREWFFTRVKEATARVRMQQGDFKAALMTFKEHKFRDSYELTDKEKQDGLIVEEVTFIEQETEEEVEEIVDQKVVKKKVKKKKLVPKSDKRNITDATELKNLIDPDPWDVIHCDPGEDLHGPQFLPVVGKAMGGLRYKGFPRINTIHTYRQDWIEWGYTKNKEGVMSTEKTPIPHEEMLRHVNLNQDVYYMKIKGAETKERVPTDIELLLTIAVINPRKALFDVQNWLEAVTNQSGTSVREHVGTQTYEDLFADRKATSDWLIRSLSKEKIRFRREFGLDLRLIQIQSISVDPFYQDLATKQYEADQKAKMTRTNANAKEYEINKTIGATVNHIGRANMRYSYMSDKDSPVRTWFEGGSSSDHGAVRSAAAGAMAGSEAANSEEQIDPNKGTNSSGPKVTPPIHPERPKDPDLSKGPKPTSGQKPKSDTDKNKGGDKGKRPPKPDNQSDKDDRPHKW